MAHKFEPADEKYWAEQRRKQQAAILRQQQEKASKTNFKDLFEDITTQKNISSTK